MLRGSRHTGPVADLVDPYATKETAAETVGYICAWLDSHPGRWAMFAEGEQGVSTENFSRNGYEVAQKTDKLTRIRRAYARLPHPEGESLRVALGRTAPDSDYPGDLPALEKDTFSWTREELEAACQVARENLFPVRASRGSRGH